MKRKASRLLQLRLVAPLACITLLAACTAARRPVAEMAEAERAVRQAQASSQAYRYAPVELRSAEDKLALARDAAADGDYEDARRLAELARVEAQLAEARAEARVARQDAVLPAGEVEVVREAPRSVTTVLEGPVESDVVIERTADPAVVVVPE
ncbi:MAG: DUF4398 domain-containing protein [Thermodesulfobacteriota bacterium]